MNQLLTAAEFKELKNISKKANSDKINQAIEKAHLDLQEVLGDVFYYNVVTNVENTDYTDLFEGSEFEVGEYTLYHPGLKVLVADYTYSRYINEININHSPSGLVTKDTQDSEPATREQIKDLVKQSQVDAGKVWEMVEKYLDNNASIFPIWGKLKESGEVDYNSNSFNQTRFTFLSSGKEQ